MKTKRREEKVTTKAFIGLILTLFATTCFSQEETKDAKGNDPTTKELRVLKFDDPKFDPIRDFADVIELPVDSICPERVLIGGWQLSDVLYRSIRISFVESSFLDEQPTRKEKALKAFELFGSKIIAAEFKVIRNSIGSPLYFSVPIEGIEVKMRDDGLDHTSVKIWDMQNGAAGIYQKAVIFVPKEEDVAPWQDKLKDAFQKTQDKLAKLAEPLFKPRRVMPDEKCD